MLRDAEVDYDTLLLFDDQARAPRARFVPSRGPHPPPLPPTSAAHTKTHPQDLKELGMLKGPRVKMLSKLKTWVRPTFGAAQPGTVAQETPDMSMCVPHLAQILTRPRGIAAGGTTRARPPTTNL